MATAPAERKAPQMRDGQNPLQRALMRKNALWNERSSWVEHWRELSEYQQPRAGRFFATEVNKGQKRHNHIIDNTATQSHRILSAGLMSGVTSPARPWFRLALADKDLMQYGPVKTWLYETAELMRSIFNQSNTYRTLHSLYGELGLFGTAASVLLPDFENVIHHYPATIGEYAIATNDRGVVDTFMREMRMTVGQMVGQFGRDNVSENVKTMYDTNRLDQWVNILHVIQPRHDRDPRKRDARNMPFSSIYFEISQTALNKPLSESGFEFFPVLAPRWAVTGQDIYGSESPGMECLGDVKQLQHQQLRKGQAIDYMVNPPLSLPAEMAKNARASLPGGRYYRPAGTAPDPVASLFQVNLNLQHLTMDVQDVRERIQSAYYADLFLMLANDTRSGVTATEVAERHEEKLLMLGPVLERLHNELLTPKVDLTFNYMERAGLFKPGMRLAIPQEMQDMDVDIEFVSVLAQAQRAVAAQGTDRLLGTVTAMAQLNPAVLDKINMDQVVDDYADMFGVNPSIIVDDEIVAQTRQQRAQAQQAAQAAAAVPVAADAAKTASEIDSGGLQQVLSSMTGYGQ